MPITDAQIAAAEAVQHAAAHDTAVQVRLVAGPGTGKSSSIRERLLAHRPRDDAQEHLGGFLYPGIGPRPADSHPPAHVPPVSSASPRGGK